MKMRDKKVKKVNRIVKAGLALVCVGALLGGTLCSGKITGVRAEEEEQAAEVKAVYCDKENEYSYILYDNSEEKGICAKAGGYQVTIEEAGKDDNIDTNVYIIWDERVFYDGETYSDSDKDKREEDKKDIKLEIEDFTNKLPDNIEWEEGTVNTHICILPQKSFDDINFQDEVKKTLNENDSYMESLDESVKDGQLQQAIETLATKIENDNSFNIVVMITDQVPDGFESGTFDYLDGKDAVIYKVFEVHDTDNVPDDYIPLENWKDDLAKSIKNLDCVKIKNDINKNEYGRYQNAEGNEILFFQGDEKPANNVVMDLQDNGTSQDDGTPQDDGTDTTTADGTTSETHKKDDATDDFVILSDKTNISSDHAELYIQSPDGETLDEKDVEISLGGRGLEVKKDPNYSSENNISKWIVKGEFNTVATASDAGDGYVIVKVKGKKIASYMDKAGLLDKFTRWFKESTSHKIIFICGCMIFILVIIFIILLVRLQRKRKRGRRGNIPHGAPSSSPDIQLRSGVSPTAETNVLARRAGEQNMQAMQGQIPANNTMQVQLQIIGRNPKIINTYINGSIFVGRANTCDVFINDATISRQHFALECVNGEMFIQPLVATNGTKLNGQRINDKHQLYPNDRIQVGTVGIIVRW